MEKQKRLNANQIKAIAIIAMTIDHLTWAFFPGTQAVWYVFVLHIIGRLTAYKCQNKSTKGRCGQKLGLL